MIKSVIASLKRKSASRHRRSRACFQAIWCACVLLIVRAPNRLAAHVVAAGPDENGQVATNGNDQDKSFEQTKAERTAFRETSRHAECVEYCKHLAVVSEYVDFKLFGYSAMQRELPLLVLSKQKQFYATQLTGNTKPVVFIQNAIHPGECAGKDASLMLLRDIAVRGMFPEILDNVIIVVVPILNADGHERFGPFSRINQNGPDEMGWRTAARNLNLNRDFMKVDAVETRSLLNTINAWKPDLFIDTHTTDGGDWQYDVGYSFASRAMMEPPIRKWLDDVWMARVPDALRKLGHVPVEYFNLIDSRDPEKGIADHIFTPRYATGYMTLLNRPSLLVETHMLKSYEQRVRAQYQILLQTLSAVAADPQALRKAVRESDEMTRQSIQSAMAEESNASTNFPIRFKHREKAERVTFLGFEHEVTESPISGTKRIRYDSAAMKEYDVDRYVAEEIAETVTPPYAYVVPAAWAELVEILRTHQIQAGRLQAPISLDAQVYYLKKPEFAGRPYEGRFRVSCEAEIREEKLEVPAGSLIVPLDQPKAKIIMHLLEPNAPDSLVAWGFFHAVFERKEYAEAYILEKLAEDMLAKDKSLKETFEKKLASDPEFAADPRRRLYFFYERSPYFDKRLGRYPILRIPAPKELDTFPY